jgi:hypothetical protein
VMCTLVMAIKPMSTLDQWYDVSLAFGPAEQERTSAKSVSQTSKPWVRFEPAILPLLS